MSAELICVVGCTLKGSTAGDVVAVVPLTSVISTHVSVSGNKAYHAIGFSIVNGSFSTTGVLLANSVKSSGTLLKFVLKTAQISCILLGPNSTTQTSTVSVDNGGQTKVKAI